MTLPVVTSPFLTSPCWGDRSPRLSTLRRDCHRRVVARGMTVVELFVTVFLVGVLVALAVPGYQSYRVKTNQRLTAQKIGAMQLAIARYFVENRSYPADLASVGFGAERDPWGNLYVYYSIFDNGKGGARKDKALNPINTDFDLYSMGPDGVSATQLDNSSSVDDVIRARNGAFLGVSADF